MTIKQFTVHFCPLLLSLFTLAACQQQVDTSQEETILARVGDRSISLNEFLRRAEYTPRPPYCRGDSYIHKKIVLNSLIAEKMLALEAGETNRLTENVEFQTFITGRKEQAMRQWLYHTQATQRVQLDSNEIKLVYDLAGRRYQTAYFTLDESELAEDVGTLLAETPAAFDSVFRVFSEQTEPPVREVRWEEPHNVALREAFYSQPLAVGQVLGPIPADDSQVLFLKVAGWTDRLAVGEQQARQRWNDVRDYLADREAQIIFTNYVGDLMAGKELLFNEPVFWRLVKILDSRYYKTRNEIEDAFQEKFWSEVDRKLMSMEYEEDLENLDPNLPFFYVDEQQFSVGAFTNLVNSHPLVFRQRKFERSEFPEQFKLAVADLIRDQYLNEEAYRLGYDEVAAVGREAAMWRDNLLGLYSKYDYLDRIGYEGSFSQDYQTAIEIHLNPLIDSLQAKYSSEIEINTAAFEDIEITRIDFFAIHTNAPYPIIVPNFPLITTDNRLDYGSRME